MRERLRSALSRYFDGESTAEEARRVEDLLSSSEEARSYLAQLERLRSHLRPELPESDPDVTGKVMAAISQGERDPRARRLRLTAAFAAGALAGAVFIGLTVRRPNPVAVADIPGRVLAAQNQVNSLTARLYVVETGWHPDVNRRVFDGEIEYLAPETLRVELDDETVYPSPAWIPNDSSYVVDEDVTWSVSVAACPVEALPECTPSEPRVQVRADREPFPDAVPAPLDLVVPIAGFSRAGEPPSLGADVIDGREVVGVEVSVAQASALLEGLTSLGNWRQLHPTDRVELWLDRSALVPMALSVYPADTPDRLLWAIRQGYDDHSGEPILQVTWSEVSINGTGAPSMPPPPDVLPLSHRFVDGPVSFEQILAPSHVPEGMTLYRTGTVDPSSGSPVSVVSWTDGRAWLKIRWTDRWEGDRLFGDLGELVRQAAVASGVVYLDERGDRIGIHGEDLDAVLAGSLTTDAMLEVAANLGFEGLPIPNSWDEAATTT
ncbi:MAG TPA: hypothetical protein VK990_07720, partial [Acidimicrobiia bacterium]|nr:hypothetical protein [Acidimicrobiia bacterium]